MTNAIFLTTTEPFSGKSIYALGLMNLLASQTDKLAYFKPIITGGKKEKDRRLELLKEHFNLSQSYEDMFAFTRKKALKEINSGNEAFLIDTIIERFKKLQENYDFVVVEGTDFTEANTNVEFDGNISIAKNLGIPVALVLNCDKRPPSEILDLALASVNGFTNKGVQILTLVANKIGQNHLEEVRKKLQAVLPPDMVVSVIPVHEELSNPTMAEIRESLGANLLFGEKFLTNRVDHSIVGAMQLHNFLTRLEQNTLVVTPGDRGDIIIGAL